MKFGPVTRRENASLTRSLLVMVAAFAPRLGVLFIWLARPAMVNAAFDTWILPALGIIFLFLLSFVAAQLLRLLGRNTDLVEE